VPDVWEQIGAALALLVLLEIRTALARHGIGGRRREDQDTPHGRRASDDPDERL
jgi:hypothetical protein